MPPLAQRFEAKVDRRGEHHLWLGAKDHKGIGLVRVEGALTTARRVAWELAHGPLPEGRRVGGCAVEPGCVRVEHLSVAPGGERPATTGGRRGPRGSGTLVETRPGVWKLTVGHKGLRHHRRFRGGEPEAVRALAMFVEEVKLAARREAPTVDGLVLGYLDSLVPSGYAAGTVARYRSLHRCWILPVIGHIRVRRLFAPAVQELLDVMADAGQSQSSIRQARALLAGAYRWSQRHGHAKDDPTANTEWPWEHERPRSAPR